ncbi:hypothetical protein ONZ43_g6363 [Nemania bipapillata]|uniref:Uncharacterized protein n=1 Tax=Nemania bipapillata TaxID=110536 RepID=A0ACC2HZZ5_9PEZI|nr:hypothetical protein ONZ43_g6363 [Nemania bipapillata]
MSENRRVTFSPSPPLRGVLKHNEPHPRDSGVGSSSSDHTGSSGSLDEIFTARDYNLQSNNVDALREALADAIKDIDQWKNKYNKKNAELIDTRKSLRETEKLYKASRDHIQQLEERMGNQDVAHQVQNSRIDDLESEVSKWEVKYNNLLVDFDELEYSVNSSILPASSYDFGPRSRREDTDMASRLKERINREQADSFNIAPAARQLFSHNRREKRRRIQLILISL